MKSLVTPRIFKIVTMEARTLAWWNDNRYQLDMNPRYQRRSNIWSKSNKAFLIDTILNNYDIPKLYIADFTFGIGDLNVSKLPYAIIDGKQRMEAIFDFFDNKLKLNENFIWNDQPELKLGNLYYSDLKATYPKIASRFDNANLSIMTVITNDESSINNLFIRLNRSTPLTGAEIRNAIVGRPTEITRNLANHVFFTSNIKFNTSRGTDFDTAGKLLMFEYYSKPVETKRRNLDEFVEHATDNQKLELAGRKVLEVLDMMSTIFLPKDPLLSTAGMIPVYFWLVRNLSFEIFTQLRETLEEIERTRKQVNNKLRNNIFINDLENKYVRYSKYFNTPNDATSYRIRYEFILNEIQKNCPEKLITASGN